MPVFLIYFALFVAGGLSYGLLELAFRGHTHWSMLLAGGACFLILFTINRRSREPRWKKWIMGGACITAVEFVTGCIVNLKLGLGVWDYSKHAFDLMGQICLLFTLLWTALSAPVMELCTLTDRLVFRRRER